MLRAPGQPFKPANHMNSKNHLRRPLVRLEWMVAFVCGLLGFASPCLAADGSDRLLTTAAAVRNLSAAEAAQKIPVKLRGVVTFYDETLFSRFIQDDTAGIYLLELTNNMPVVSPGTIVEVEGVTGPGEYASVVQPTSIKVIGEGPLPAARRVSLEELVSGQDDSQLVEFTGLVRSVRFEKDTEYHLLDFSKGGERFTLYTKQLPAALAPDLVEATVRVRGVCSTMFNHQRQLFGIRLLNPKTEPVIIEKAAASNSFNQPAHPINSLLQFAPEGTSAGRIKVAGTVSFAEPGKAVFIQDDKTGLYCQTLQRDTFKPGDQVEILGFPAKGDYTPILEDAVIHKTGTGTAPTAAATDVNEILTGIHDCRLVQLPAQVLANVQRGANRFLLLQAGDFTFQAYLPQKINEAELSAILPSSEVKVTGVCKIERGNQWQAGDQWRAASFHLLLRSLPDVVVVQAPAMMPAGENTGALICLGVLCVALILWVVLLRLRLRRSA